MTRESTNRILELLDEGALDAKTLARDLLNYLSEADVTEFAHAHELIDEEEDIDYECDEDYKGEILDIESANWEDYFYRW